VISVRIVKDKNIWEKFVLDQGRELNQPSGGTFLQSWAWGEFQAQIGKEIFRTGVFEGNNLVGLSLLTTQKAKTASFLYVPAGPIFSKWNGDYFEKWLEFASNLAKKKGLTFLRIEPRVINDEAKELVKSYKFVTAPEYTQPECTAVLDLGIGEQELLGGMSDSTRYNIGMSQRKGVTIREGEAKEIGVFVEFLKETAKKRVLTLPIEKDYHKKQFEILGEEGIMKLFIAEHENKPLAAALVLFYGDSTYYLHAANSFQKSKLRVSYPLVWHAALEGKKKGLKWFDFWGIAQSDDPGDSWAGITSFKLSFGAERVCFDYPLDLPFKGSYKISRFVETWRKPIRKITQVVFSPGSKIVRFKG
jgi:lipid II:glycine glycyltransferase (peptidoglycan interpeptide bridge formation enzyme)